MLADRGFNIGDKLTMVTGWNGRELFALRHSSKVRFHPVVKISIKNLLYQISYTFGKSAMTLPCKKTLIGITDIFERCLDIQCSV